MAMICKQPNGKYCRFSGVVDTFTHHNMTAEQYIELKAEQAREEARDILKNHLFPLEEAKERFQPRNMSKKKFKKICREMEK